MVLGLVLVLGLQQGAGFCITAEVSDVFTVGTEMKNGEVGHLQPGHV